MKSKLLKTMKTIKSKLLNNLGYKILAIVLAFILWAVVVNITDPTITVTVNDIPVDIINENSVVTDTQTYSIDSGETASITITGARSNVYKVMKASAYVATADLSSVSVTGTVEVTVEFADDYTQYKNLVSINEESDMIIDILPIKTKTFDIEIEYSGTTEENYDFENVSIDSETVDISATKKVINSIATVAAVVDVSGVTSDLDEAVDLVLYDEDGDEIDIDSNDITLSIESVNVTGSAVETKEVPLSITSSGTVADGYLLSGITLSFDTVTIKGKPEVIDQISSIDLGTIDVDDATSDIEKEIDITEFLGEGIMITDDSESTVTATADIEEPVTKTITLSADDISLEDLSSDYTAEINKSVTITLTGLEDTLDDITASSLEAYVDLSDSTTGTSKYEVEMTLPDGVTSTTAKVSITVTEDEETTTEETTTEDTEEDTEE